MHTYVHIKHTEGWLFLRDKNFLYFCFIGSRFKRERILEAKKEPRKRSGKEIRGRQPPGKSQVSLILDSSFGSSPLSLSLSLFLRA